MKLPTRLFLNTFNNKNILLIGTQRENIIIFVVRIKITKYTQSIQQKGVI